MQINPRFSREEEVKDALEDWIFEILDYPFAEKETRQKMAKEMRDRAYQFIADQLEAVEAEKDEQSRDITELEEIIKENRDHVEELRLEISSMESQISSMDEKMADMQLRIDNPTEWLGRQFGI